MRDDLNLSFWSITSSSPVWHDDFLESVFFLGNGRMGVRGYLPEEPDRRPVQRGLYLAGIFGEIKPGITDFVNLPTPVFQEVFVDGQLARLSSAIERTLDMRAAVFTARYTLCAAGKQVQVAYSRFFPKEQPTLLLQRTVLTPLQDAEIRLRCAIMTDSCNCPVPDDQTKTNTETVQLAALESAGEEDGGIRCTFRIRGNGLTVRESLGVRTSGPARTSTSGTSISCTPAVCGAALTVDTAACILTSRDVDPRLASLPEDWDYDELFRAHKAAWAETWKHCDVTIPSLNADLQTGLRYSMFQLMASCSSHDPTVSIGARGLTHGRYKGCYFWDTDMFMFPFFLKNDPAAARSLCLYRVRSLPAARAHAAKMNASGARYPWMASLDGSEQCESWDIGCSEVHITADVAFGVWQYYMCTGWLEQAAPGFIETARFWRSRYIFRPEAARADLMFCKGPDEYCGITSNNLYTNVLVQHNLDLALRAAADLKEKRPALYAELHITPEELDGLRALRDAIPWPRDPHTGRLTQDETFHLLEPTDISALKKDAGACYHSVCFDRLQRYKVIKQADVLLLMTRLPALFTAEEKRAAWEDFEPLCLHDSTLSFATHALFALQNGIADKGMVYLEKALLLDLRDVMGNTGEEGLHLACMGEAWQAAMELA